MSVATVRQAGEANQPSPSIWADCPKHRLIDEGSGYFFHEDFVGGAVSATTLPSQTIGTGHLTFDGDTDTVTAFKAGEFGGYLDVETDGDDNDAAALFSRTLARIDLNSEKKVWLEARVELGAIADQGFFFGLVEEAGASRDVVADNAGGLIGESLVGFQVLAANQSRLDIVAKLDAGSPIVIAEGAHTMVANTEVKLGLRFDGVDTIDFFVNGVKVASHTIDATTFPVGVDFSPIVALKTGTGAAQSFAIDWFRVGYQSRI